MAESEVLVVVSLLSISIVLSSQRAQCQISNDSHVFCNRKQKIVFSPVKIASAESVSVQSLERVFFPALTVEHNCVPEPLSGVTVLDVVSDLVERVFYGLDSLHVLRQMHTLFCPTAVPPDNP